MLEVDCCLHFESGQARLSLALRFGAQGRRAAEPQPDRMVGTRAHPSTSSPCPAELPETRGSKRKLASPQGREGHIVAQSELGTLARQPSAAELRAAEAARSRLYGARPEDASQVSLAPATRSVCGLLLFRSLSRAVGVEAGTDVPNKGFNSQALVLDAGPCRLLRSVCQMELLRPPQTLTARLALPSSPTATPEMPCRCVPAQLSCLPGCSRAGMLGCSSASCEWRR